MEQIQPLLNLLSGKAGWLPATFAWMSSLRLALKPFSARIQSRLTAQMAQAAADQDPDEERDWESVLHARWYRAVGFFLDLFFSFKLPTHAQFMRAVEAGKSTATQVKQP